MKKFISLFLAAALFLGCGCVLAENPGEIRCMGLPWGVSVAEIQPSFEEIGGESEGLHFTAVQWYMVEEYLNKGAPKYIEPLGFSYLIEGLLEISGDGPVFLQVFDHSLGSLLVNFVYKPEEDGKLSSADADTALVSVDMYMELDKENTESDYASLLASVCNELGPVSEHKEREDVTGEIESWEIWHGANGTHACLYLQSSSEAVLKYTFDGMDGLVDRAHEAYLLPFMEE